jgi:hypothetical protein
MLKKMLLYLVDFMREEKIGIIYNSKKQDRKDFITLVLTCMAKEHVQATCKRRGEGR